MQLPPAQVGGYVSFDGYDAEGSPRGLTLGKYLMGGGELLLRALEKALDLSPNLLFVA